MTDARVEVAGEALVLLPERCVLRERTSTLLVADAHWGKAAAFRAAGVPVPGGTTGEGLARLDAALVRTGARRIAFLGDLLHAREGRAPATLSLIAAWRERHGDVEMRLVRGNHDRAAGDPPRELGIDCVDEPFADAPFVYRHHPRDDPRGYVLAGHVHPAVTLRGVGRQRQRLACFWFGAGCAVLPAFGPFTGTAGVEPRPGDRVFVVAGGEVVEVRAG
jgi:DNA ligase-associated metallophosphoesterase